MSSSNTRLTQIDALRGLAAMAVVLFHFTYGFQTRFAPDAQPLLAFPLGHFGVNLFFIISGFVIFMTLEKTQRGADFVVSRFSRLYPAYWCAVALTFAITHIVGLPNYLRSVPEAVANLLMFHGLLRVPHVDGVYWTLEVELLFYCAAFALYKFKLLGRIHLYLWALMALRLVYFVLENVGISLPWTISRLLILQYIPWFAMGIAIYQLVHGQDRRALLTMGFAVASLAVADSLFVAALALVFGAAVWAAAQGRLRVLEARVLVWLGAISYPLYLLHENIGWSLLLQARKAGLDINVAILLVCAVTLLLAHGLHLVVEKPAMRWIRERYRARRT